MSECERKMGCKSQVGRRDNDTSIPLVPLVHIPKDCSHVNFTAGVLLLPLFYWLDVFWAAAAAQNMMGNVCGSEVACVGAQWQIYGAPPT